MKIFKIDQRAIFVMSSEEFSGWDYENIADNSDIVVKLGTEEQPTLFYTIMRQFINIRPRKTYVSLGLMTKGDFESLLKEMGLKDDNTLSSIMRAVYGDSYNEAKYVDTKTSAVDNEYRPSSALDTYPSSQIMYTEPNEAVYRYHKTMEGEPAGPDANVRIYFRVPPADQMGGTSVPK